LANNAAGFFVSPSEKFSLTMLQPSQLNGQIERASLLQIFGGRATPLGLGKVPSAFVKKSVRGAVKLTLTGLDGVTSRRTAGSMAVQTWQSMPILLAAELFGIPGIGG
jgi:hypothetical protein